MSKRRNQFKVEQTKHPHIRGRACRWMWLPFDRSIASRQGPAPNVLILILIMLICLFFVVLLFPHGGLRTSHPFSFACFPAANVVLELRRSNPPPAPVAPHPALPTAERPRRVAVKQHVPLVHAGGSVFFFFFLDLFLHFTLLLAHSFPLLS